jgi:hypothetical protein
VLCGGPGADRLDGGDGSDTVTQDDLLDELLNVERVLPL